MPLDHQIPERGDHDVIVIGGSLAGSATAWLLRRRRPDWRIVVLEKSETFGRRVGEATVEVSGYFLSKVLGLTAHLNGHNLAKQGMRFWFDGGESIADASEIGGRFLARMPAWQVDRAVLDTEMLARAAAAGVEVRRGIKVRRVTLQPGGLQRVEWESADGPTGTLSARWVVDASGFAALLARQEGWFRRNDAHPTTAVWTRWRGVRDLDGTELADRHPDWAAACPGIRATATNHLVGDGWWAWSIPLKGGEYSIGLVFDQRRVRIPPGGAPAERLRRFLSAHPVGRELLADAEPVPGDAHWRSHLPYLSERIAGDGFVLVGDAAGLIDPFYSPGLDWAAYTVTRAVGLVDGATKHPDLPAALAAHNTDFSRSYRRWFEAVYRDKYDVVGDFELMRVVFPLDLCLYYAGVVSQPVRRGPVALSDPVFSRPASAGPYHLMRWYNRRLAAMGRERRRRGTFGRANRGRRLLLDGFLPDRGAVGAVPRLLLRYLALELREGWRTWFRTGPAPAPIFNPGDQSAPQAAAARA